MHSAHAILPRPRNLFHFTMLIAVLAGMLTGCQIPERSEPARSWPPEPRPQESVLERTDIIPGTPEYRPPTAPPSPQPRRQPPPPVDETAEPPPAPRPLSPHPPGAGNPTEPPPEVESPPEGNEAQMRELFPHVRADLEARIIEFDGIVPIDAHHPDTPRVYLEVIVCTPDSKEHESLVMTEARPSHVHAALLAIGLSPGHPGRFTWDNGDMTTIPPEGDPVTVTFIYEDDQGKRHEIPATRWVVHAETAEPFVPEDPGNTTDDSADNGNANNDSRRGFVFAGSIMRKRMGREVYDADGIGTLVGLHTFGAETIAWREVMSPDSHIETPEWIADSDNILPYESPVTVRIRPAE